MKKALAVLILTFAFIGHAHAAVAPLVPPPVIVGPGVSGGPALLPFAGAVAMMLAVTYLNAEGVPFPLCGVIGDKCYQEYPEAVHKDGV